ncbi:MAG: hypothetical protein DRN04_06635 [Thermoprotei archaeon]|nr:MAG: hypothetical protein DRN04_06635 [Thermoprotei archaeon]
MFSLVSRVSVILTSTLALITAYSAIEVFITGSTSAILLVPAVAAVFAQALLFTWSIITLVSLIKNSNGKNWLNLTKALLIGLSLALCTWSLPCLYEKYVAACTRKVILPEFEYDYSLLIGGALLGLGGVLMIAKQAAQDLPVILKSSISLLSKLKESLLNSGEIVISEE